MIQEGNRDETSDIEADVLWELKKQVLKDNTYFLCQYLDFNRHYIYLLSCGLFNHDDVEEIKGTCRTRKEKVAKMLDLLSRGPSTALDRLRDSIRNEGTQNFVEQKLEESLKNTIENWRNRQVPMRFPPQQAPRSAVEEVCPNCQSPDVDPLPVPGDPGAPVLPMYLRQSYTGSTC